MGSGRSIQFRNSEVLSELGLVWTENSWKQVCAQQSKSSISGWPRAWIHTVCGCGPSNAIFVFSSLNSVFSQKIDLWGCCFFVCCNWVVHKGQLCSEWIFDVIVSPKMQTKNCKDFCPTKQTRILALIFGEFLVSVDSFFGCDSCFLGRAEILVIFGLHFGRNNDLINAFWI